MIDCSVIGIGQKNQHPGPFVVRQDDYTRFCAGPFKRLLVGDFNGDSRMDLYCASQEEVEIRLTTGNWTNMESAGEVGPEWCFGARLRIGDFDGDGRSDRLCAHPDTGRMALDLNRRPPSYAPAARVFDGLTNKQIQTGFCSHEGEMLHVAVLPNESGLGDDALADLVCFTKSSGEIVALRNPFAQPNLQFETLREGMCEDSESYLTLFDLFPHSFPSSISCLKKTGFGGTVHSFPSLNPKEIEGVIFPGDAFGPGRLWPAHQRALPTLFIYFLFLSFISGLVLFWVLKA